LKVAIFYVQASTRTTLSNLLHRCGLHANGHQQRAGFSPKAHVLLRHISQIEAALPLDMIALSMHGAMVAEGYDDCEGDMLQRIRNIAGNKVAIGLELDPHCHLSEKMLRNSDAIVMFKEYPHTDFLERAHELLKILEDKVNRKVDPVMSVYDCHMISTYHTTRDPMKSFVQKIKALEKKDGILSISIAHGFPWADVSDIGTKILVITDGDPVTGAALAKELGQELFSMRGHGIIPPERYGYCG